MSGCPGGGAPQEVAIISSHFREKIGTVFLNVNTILQLLSRIMIALAESFDLWIFSLTLIRTQRLVSLTRFSDS